MIPSGGPETQHARPFDIAGVDAIAQSHVGVAARANIAHGGEAGAHGQARVLGAGDGFARDGNAESLIPVLLGSPVRCVCTSIKPGRQVAFERSIGADAAGRRRRSRRTYRGYRAVRVEDDDLVREHTAGTNVQKLAAAHSTRSRIGKGRRRPYSKSKQRISRVLRISVLPIKSSSNPVQRHCRIHRERSLKTKRKNTIRSAEHGAVECAA